MSQGADESRRVRAKARPNQHISAIAHLFFDNKADTVVPPSKTLERHIMVVGTGRDTCAPYTAAGLGHHLLDQSAKLKDRGLTAAAVPTRQVYLGEPSPVCFSALSHLQKSTYRLPMADEAVPWARQKVAPGPVLRLFPGSVPSEDFSGGLSDGTFYIRHLDLPTEAELQALETRVLAGHPTSLANDGTDALLWCVRATAAVSLALTGRFGRLLRVVQPREIHLLVFGGPGHGRNKTQAELSHQARSLALEKSQRLLEYVAGGVAVDSRFMAVSAEERSFQLCSLARQMSLS